MRLGDTLTVFKANAGNASVLPRDIKAGIAADH